MRSDSRVWISVAISVLGMSLTATAQSPSGNNDDRRDLIPISSPTKKLPAPPLVLGPMRSPVMGFVYSPEFVELRAIQGVAGASVLTEPLTLPPGATNLHLAPGQKYALVERDGSSLGLIPLTMTSANSVVEIPGSLVKPDIISFSPNGSSAAAYSASEGILQVITGLPNVPQITRQFSRADLPDDVRVLAISDNGQALLEGTAGSSIYLLSSDVPQFLYSVADVAALVFTPSSEDALVIDRIGGRSTLLQNVRRASGHIQITDGLTGLDGDVAADVNANTAFISSSSSDTIWQVNLSTLQVNPLSLPKVGASLQRMQGPGRYLVSYTPGEPTLIFEAASSENPIYFVPAQALSRRNPAR